MAKKLIGEQFYKIGNSSVMEEISKAAISLRLDLLYIEVEVSQEFIEEVFNELKKTINIYIDGQKEVLLNLQKQICSACEKG